MSVTLSLRSITLREYHAFFQDYQPDPWMTPEPYCYDKQQVDRLYAYKQRLQSIEPELGIFDDHQSPIGLFSIQHLDRKTQSGYVGIILVHDGVKNRGYGTEALHQGIHYAQETLGLKNLYADTTGENIRMQHVLEKLGFTLFEHIPQGYQFGDKVMDRLCYRLKAEEKV